MGCATASLTLFPLLGQTPPPRRSPDDVLVTRVGTHMAYVSAVAAIASVRRESGRRCATAPPRPVDRPCSPPCLSGSYAVAEVVGADVDGPALAQLPHPHDA